MALLMDKGVEVRVQRSSSMTQPSSFEFAYTDPAKDFDVSSWMQNTGMVELGITKVGWLSGRVGWVSWF